MQSVILSGEFVSAANEGKVTVLTMKSIVGYGEKELAITVTVKTYGKLAEFAKSADYETIIVTGQLEFHNYAPVIQASSIVPALPGTQVNQVSIVGRLGKDPEPLQFGETTGSKFSIAVTRTKQETDWFNVTLFRKPADIANMYLKKGQFAGITGELTARLYNEKTYYDLIGSRLTLLGGSQANTESNEEDDDDNW